MLPEEKLELAIAMVQQQTDVFAHLNNDIDFKKFIADVVFVPVSFCDKCGKDFKYKFGVGKASANPLPRRY